MCLDASTAEEPVAGPSQQRQAAPDVMQVSTSSNASSIGRNFQFVQALPMHNRFQPRYDYGRMINSLISYWYSALSNILYLLNIFIIYRWFYITYVVYWMYISSYCVISCNPVNCVLNSNKFFPFNIIIAFCPMWHSIFVLTTFLFVCVPCNIVIFLLLTWACTFNFLPLFSL